MKEKYSLESFPAWKAATARLNELGTELSTAQTREERMRTELTSRVHQVQSEIAMEAEALLAGNVGVARDMPIETQKLRDDHVQVRHGIEVLQQACKMQQGIVERIRQEASAEICRKVTPEHRELVQRIAAGIKDLANAITAEQKFHDALESNGFDSGHLRRPSHPDLGDVNDRSSTAWTCLNEMYSAGLLERKDVPGLVVVETA